jgi:hypothetical protein
VLLPPPERLRRVILYIPCGAFATNWIRLRAVDQLSYAVDVTVSGGTMSTWPCFSTCWR